MHRISSLRDFAFVFFLFDVDGNKKLSGYNLFYSRLARNSAADGWTSIYPHLGVINVNGLVVVSEAARPVLGRVTLTPPLFTFPTPVATVLAGVTPGNFSELFQLSDYNFFNRNRNRILIVL